jgi:glycosyltransferase involved in cell wall biosynthesis
MKLLEGPKNFNYFSFKGQMMGKESRVSVIMNCYNGEKYLREAIDSVYAQSYKNWEIIFWDNASTDSTSQIAKSYDSRLRYFRAEVNTHLGPARNMALEKAKTTYIAFLDSDDIYLPYTLQRQFDLMESANYGLVYAETLIIGEDSKKVKRQRLRYYSGYIFDKLLRRYEISMCSVMIRRSVVDEDGLSFGEELQYCPEHNLFMKIAAQHKVGVIHEPIVKYRWSSSSLSRKTRHLVAKEIGYTLDELQKLYPEKVNACSEAMVAARAKLNYYDAINLINKGDYPAARSVLIPVVARRWEFMVLYLILFLPIPRSFLLRMLNR